MLTKILRLIEILALALFFGFLPVLFCVAAAGFTNVVFLEERGIWYWALGGLCVGLIIDVMFVKSWVNRAYQTNSKILAAIYIFYSVFALGLGMGVPILNFVLCIAAGLYIARKMHFAEAEEQARKQAFKRMAKFCAAVMALICCLITLWAIAGQMIGYKLETPLLTFTLTVPIFFAVVFTGGTVLVLAQYWLTATAAKVTFRLSWLATKSKG